MASTCVRFAAVIARRRASPGSRTPSSRRWSAHPGELRRLPLRRLPLRRLPSAALHLNHHRVAVDLVRAVGGDPAALADTGTVCTDQAAPNRAGEGARLPTVTYAASLRRREPTASLK